MSFRRSAATFPPNRPRLGHLLPQKFLNAPATANAVTTCCWTRGAGLSSTNSETLTRYEACSAERLDVSECGADRARSFNYRDRAFGSQALGAGAVILREAQWQAGRTVAVGRRLHFALPVAA